MASTVSTQSASANSGAGSNPACIGWVVASALVEAEYSTTGNAASSASRASEGRAPAGAVRWAMISGRFARASASAATPVAAASGAPPMVAAWRGAGRAISTGSASASRGRLR
jgi:hypothetical protein